MAHHLGDASAMTDAILARDVALSWRCPHCGAPPARDSYLSTMIASRCKPDCPKEGPTQ
jgi:hypothetical protein